MKHFSKLFLLLLAPAAAFAQPTITQADMPVAGTTWLLHSDYNGGQFPISPAGGNQNWNYSSIFLNFDTTSIQFKSPAVTPTAYQQAFPNANLVDYDPGSGYTSFYRVDNSGFYLDGYYIVSGSGPAEVLDPSPDALIVPTPISFNGTRTHTSRSSFIDNQTGEKNVSYTYTTVLADAYGSLTLPSGTFPNVLRVKQFSYHIDTIYSNVNGNWVAIQTKGPYDSLNTYTWLQNGNNSYLMELGEDPQNPGISIPYFANYFTSTVLSAPSPLGIPQIQPYPNPATTLIRIPVETQGAEQLLIFNVLGKPVTTESVRGINNLVFGTSHLPAGAYSYRLQGKGGAELQKGNFTVIR
jgi:hypothetical protein